MTRAFASAAADFLLEHGPLSLGELHELAVDRVQLPPPRHDRYEPYDDVVPPEGWRR